MFGFLKKIKKTDAEYDNYDNTYESNYENTYDSDYENINDGDYGNDYTGKNISGNEAGNENYQNFEYGNEDYESGLKIDAERERLRQEQLTYGDLDEKKQFIESNCDRISEAEKRIGDLKREYKAVNEYITDIQTIEELPESQSEKLIYLAKKVVVLEKDRKDFGKSMSKLTNRQYSQIRENEDNIVEILKTMSEDEKYCETVKTDLKYLEGERAALEFEIKERKKRLYLLRGISKIAIISFAVLLTVLLTLGFGYQKNVSLLLYIVVAIGSVVCAVLFSIYNSDVYKLKLDQMRRNRAISLQNKVKIKYVNVVSKLQYSYEKHGVKSSYQLSKIWTAYMQLKQEREVYNRASNRLIEAEEELVELLDGCKVRDSGVWISQAYALIEKREMAEIKQSLNSRRNKLKNSLDYNKEIIESAREDIKKVILSDKHHARELMAIIDSYDA